MALIKGYFEKGGFQVQFNMVDSEVLEEAQENQDYRDLVVRISGYSALFIGLSERPGRDLITARVRFVSRPERDWGSRTRS